MLLADFSDKSLLIFLTSPSQHFTVLVLFQRAYQVLPPFFYPKLLKFISKATQSQSDLECKEASGEIETKTMYTGERGDKAER